MLLIAADAVADQAMLELATAHGFADIVALLGGDPNDPALANHGPYTDIVTDEAEVRHFLRWEMVPFEDVWIPTQSDLEGLESKLQAYLTEPGNSDLEWVDYDYVRVSSRLYTRHYSGFIRDGQRFIVCCLDMYHWLDNSPPDNTFPWISDGGCSLAVVVFDAETGAVVRITCHGVA